MQFMIVYLLSFLFYFLVYVSFHYVFLSLCMLALVGFLLLHKDAISMLSCFFLTTSIQLALGLDGIHFAATSM